MKKISEWFWSAPWNARHTLSTSDLYFRLGVVRILICAAVFLVVINQGMHIFQTDPLGISFYYFDRVPWFYNILGVEKTYPLIDYLNFFISLIALVCAAAGFRFRTSIAVAIVTLFIIHGTRSGYNGNNHHVMYVWTHVLFVMLFSKAGNAFGMARSEVKNLEAWEAIWPVRLIQIILILFYFSAGIAKFRHSGMAWLLDGSGIQRIMYNFKMDGSWLQDLAIFVAGHPTFCWLLSISIVVIELMAPLLLSKKRIIAGTMVILYMLFHIGARMMTGVPFHYLIVLLLFYVDFVGMTQEITRHHRSVIDG